MAAKAAEIIERDALWAVSKLAVRAAELRAEIEGLRRELTTANYDKQQLTFEKKQLSATVKELQKSFVAAENPR